MPVLVPVAALHAGDMITLIGDRTATLQTVERRPRLTSVLQFITDKGEPATLWARSSRLVVRLRENGAVQ